MLVTRCITASKARRYVDLSVLVVIAASFSLGAAMSKTGAAAYIANWLMVGGLSPWWSLALVYALTTVFTCCCTDVSYWHGVGRTPGR